MPAARTPRRRRWSAGALVALVATFLPTAPVLADPPKPPAPPAAGSELQQRNAELNAARRQAQAQEHALSRAKDAVATAHAELTSRAASAEAAIRRYAKTMESVGVARAEAAAAEAAAAAAAAQVADQQAVVRDFARAAYMSGGPISSLATVLTAGGPTAILNRASLLGQISESQADMLRELDAALRVQAQAAAAAERSRQRFERIAARADAERRSALVAMANQQALLEQLADKQEKVTAKVAEQETAVAELARERDAARQAQIAAERAALAAAWQSMQDVGDAMPWATRRQGHEAVKWAKRQLGVPYSWGGGDADGATLGAVNEEGNPAGLTTVGFDCSGLTLYAWAHAGFTLDHYTGYQWVEGHRIDLDDLRAGDLVFFAHDVSDPLTIHHVGIYVGGNRMIDAPHTGAKVRYDEVFVPGLIGAIRP